MYCKCVIICDDLSIFALVELYIFELRVAIFECSTNHDRDNCGKNAYLVLS